jgi:uncharacterized coiled-coil protein SlyX
MNDWISKALIGAFAAIISWIVKRLYDDTQKVNHRISELELKVAEQHPTKHDMEKLQEALTENIRQVDKSVHAEIRATRACLTDALDRHTNTIMLFLNKKNRGDS